MRNGQRFRFALRTCALILLVQLAVSALAISIIALTGLVPLSPEAISALSDAPHILFIVFVCMLSLGLQASALYWILRHPIGVMRAATAFIKKLALRQGGKLETELTHFDELDALVRAINATAARLESQDQALNVSREGDQAHKRIFETLANTAPLPEVLSQIALYVEQQKPHLLCSILTVDDSGTNLLLQASPSLSPEYNAVMLRIPIREGACCSGTAAYRCERVAIENIQSHPFWSKYHDAVIAAGLMSCWSEPLMSSQRELLGCFAVYQRTEALPTPEEFALIQDAANLASEAIFVADAHDRIIAVNPAFERLTGYSALSYLKKYPIDYIKIDRSFVRDVETDVSDRALCEAIITIANLMEIEVIAEGVETTAQREFLFNVGCDHGQGYLFSPPLSAWDFVEYLRKADLRLASKVA